MKLTSYVSMEVKKENRVFVFAMPFGALYADCRAVLEEMMHGVQEMEKRALEQVEKVKAAEESKEAAQPAQE